MIKQRPSVFIADDHQIVIDAIRSELEDFGDSLHFLGSATTGEEVINALNSKKIDLLILDISMPEPNGLEILQYIKKNSIRVKVLVFTMHDDLAHVSAMIRHGAHGYILKNEGARYVVDAVTHILANNKYFPNEILLKLADGFASEYFTLSDTPEEKIRKSISDDDARVLELLTQEYTAKEIADKMCIGKKAIDARLKKLRDKTGSTSEKGLVAFAVRNGFAGK
jgi:DNA-binding NarL/FixJ family response regulator